jgi:hypothetical protein
VNEAWRPRAASKNGSADVRTPFASGRALGRAGSVISADIESSPQRRITFARFMELALRARAGLLPPAPIVRPTPATSDRPETHPIFGWTIARRIEEMWAELAVPGRST